MDRQDFDKLLQKAKDAGTRSDHAAGASFAQQAVDLAKHANDTLSEGRALAALAMHQMRMRSHEDAVRSARQAIVWLRQGPDRQAEVEALLILAFSCNCLGITAEAMECCHEAVKGAQALGDNRLLAMALNRGAMVCNAFHDFEQARRFTEQAIDAALQVGDQEVLFSVIHSFANAVGHEAELCTDRGDQDGRMKRYAEALSLYERALAVAESSHHFAGQCLCLRNMALSVGILRDVASAEFYVERAMQLSKQHHLPWFIPIIEHAQAELIGLTGNDDAFIDAMLAVCRQHALEKDEQGGSIATDLYKALKRQGRFEEALHWHEELVRIERRQQQVRTDAQSRLLKDQLALEQAQREATHARAALHVESSRRAMAEAERIEWAERAQALDQAVHTDPLTGLANRRYLDDELPLQIERAREQPQALVVVMVDVDHFKNVNDRFGHLVGDAVLRELAVLLNQNLRVGDQAARYGGEEFMLILQDASPELAREVCERLRVTVAEHRWSTVAEGLAVTISVGSSIVAVADRAADVVSRADAALYRAKREGRNRCRVG